MAISARSKVEIDTISGWRRLLIDGAVQFDERDEYLYHQPLARIPALLGTHKVKSPALRALIIGGGDLCAARELIALNRFARIDVIEFNPAVLKAATVYLKDINLGAGKHASVRVWQRNALEIRGGKLAFDLFREDPAKFSTVILDVTYPDTEDTASFFTVPYFEFLSEMVEPIVGLGINAVGPEWSPRTVGGIMAALAEARFHSILYTTGIPSTYETGSGRWGFVFGSRSPVRPRDVRAMWKGQYVPSDITPEDIERGFRVPVTWNGLYTSTAPFRTGAEVLKMIAKDAKENLLAWRGDWMPFVMNGPRA